MKDVSNKSEILRKTKCDAKELKKKERKLIKDLFEKKKEISVQERLDREISQFESIRRKEMIDYNMFIIKLQSIRDDLVYQREKNEGDVSKIEKEIGIVDKLIEKYKKEEFDVCMARSDDILDRVQKIVSL